MHTPHAQPTPNDLHAPSKHSVSLQTQSQSLQSSRNNFDGLLGEAVSKGALEGMCGSGDKGDDEACLENDKHAKNTARDLQLLPHDPLFKLSNHDTPRDE